MEKYSRRKLELNKTYIQYNDSILPSNWSVALRVPSTGVRINKAS